jgi:hypothetical protein
MTDGPRHSAVAVIGKSSNAWQPGSGKNHSYLKAKMSNSAIAEVLSGLMTGGPAGNRPK